MADCSSSVAVGCGATVGVLGLDVWEHAFLLDYKPSDRPKYIEAFLGNIDWDAVESRMNVNAPAATAR